MTQAVFSVLVQRAGNCLYGDFEVKGGFRGLRFLFCMDAFDAIIGDDFVSAVLTARDMPAKGRRAAALDRRHHLQLAEAHMAGVGFAPRQSVIAEDRLDTNPVTPPSSRRHHPDSAIALQGVR
jgi:hypothetical protein